MMGVSADKGIDSKHEEEVAMGSVVVVPRYTVVKASASVEVDASTL